MNRILKAFLLFFIFIILGSCVFDKITPGPRTPVPGAADYELTGHYNKDKFYFFPYGRNFKKENLFLKALQERAKGKLYETEKSFSAEQNLAIEYDVVSFSMKKTDKNSWEYGIVLGKVGRWIESVDALKRSIEIAPKFAGSWGNLGVAEHALGNFEASAYSFNKAMEIDPQYFANKPNQNKIWGASQNHVEVIP